MQNMCFFDYKLYDIYLCYFRKQQIINIIFIWQVSSPTQYFWYRTTLMISEDINTPEAFNWKIALALVIAWILVYMCMIKGIASSGKVVYVTATFPYIVLIIFFFRGITLKGAGDGLRHLFTPSWHKILEPVVWLEAGTQIFFSLGLAFGGLIAFSSYNPVNNNCYRDAVMVSLTNCFTSMFAGIVVFSIIGFKATMVYEKCMSTRNNTISGLLGTDFDESRLPPKGTVFNVSNHDGSITSIVMPLLPVCDLDKELDNVSIFLHPNQTLRVYLVFPLSIFQSFVSVSLWYRIGFYNIYRSNKSISGSPILVCSFLLDAFHTRNRFTIWNVGGSRYIYCGLKTISQSTKRNPDWRNLFNLLPYFNGVCSWSWKLHICAFWRLQRKLSTTNHSFVWMHCSVLRLRFKKVHNNSNDQSCISNFRFADDIEMMTGQRPGLYWLLCWKYLSPLAMMSILVASFIEIAVDGSKYDAWVASKGETEKHDWPIWSVILILVLVFSSIAWIPGTAIARWFIPETQNCAKFDF